MRGTADPTWGDIFECCFKAQSSKLGSLFSLKRGKRDLRAVSFELSKMSPQVGLDVYNEDDVHFKRHPDLRWGWVSLIFARIVVDLSRRIRFPHPISVAVAHMRNALCGAGTANAERWEIVFPCEFTMSS